MTLIDIDLSLNIRQHGLHVYFQPASIVVRAREESDVSADPIERQLLTDMISFSFPL